MYVHAPMTDINHMCNKSTRNDQKWKVHLCNKYFTKENQRILVYDKASKSNVGSIFSRILYIFL